jgi:hypothetical protein
MSEVLKAACCGERLFGTKRLLLLLTLLWLSCWTSSSAKVINAVVDTSNVSTINETSHPNQVEVLDPSKATYRPTDDGLDVADDNHTFPAVIIAEGTQITPLYTNSTGGEQLGQTAAEVWGEESTRQQPEVVESAPAVVEDDGGATAALVGNQTSSFGQPRLLFRFTPNEAVLRPTVIHENVRIDLI